ncbi:O-antigen ligase family protein [Pedobacter sp.]|uniref:O-antigen ligase family protein n=1 Tax=Pedobacter sp. TaxID=1411316 RepID=UPI003D7F7CF3
MRLIVIVFMIMYLYALSFGIFMTTIFRIPAPIIFCFPLAFVFKNKNETPFAYTRELILITVAIFLYYGIGLSEFKTFTKNVFCVMICAFYFNYFVGTNKSRWNTSVLIFYILLCGSAIMLVFDSFYGVPDIRSMFMNEPVMQSPSGIAIYQFNFGYQIAALTTFLFIYTCAFNKPFLVKVGVLAICLSLLLLGMQRSAFVVFLFSISIFLLIYYRFKGLIFISIVALLCGVYYFYVVENLDGVSNIIVKNQHNNPSHNRTSLSAENLNIFLNHPFGLIFYGKDWGDVIYRNYVFAEGMTSHNAYLMFITYLGPFLGLGLLLSIYRKITAIFLEMVRMIKEPRNALLVCLCFSFLSISLNALFHNAWLIEANGPTIFLFFCILHPYKFKMLDPVTIESSTH